VLRIHETGDFDEFVKLRSKWNRVLSKSRDASPLLAWEKMAASVKYFKEKQKLRVLYVTDNNRIIAIAPLRQSSVEFKGCLGYKVIEPLAHGNTDYSNFILSEKATECLRIFLSYLYERADWDYLYIYDVPETSILVDLLSKDGSLFPRFEAEKGVVCPYIEIPSSAEEMFGNLSSNFRSYLHRSLRKLEKTCGEVEIKEYQELGSLKDSLRIFFDLHQKRWVSKGQSGNFRNKEQRGIFSYTAKLLEEKNWFALYFLTADNKPIAAKYCLKYKQKLYDNLSGWDPEYSAYSVGNLLLLKILEKCIAEGIREYDFMQGAESYKFRWTNRYRRTLNLIFVNSKLNSQLIRFGRSATKRLKMNHFFARAFGRQPPPLPAR
jgi:CelD/BcsL family acetyltransferase involved in cellulose biosynthesis